MSKAPGNADRLESLAADYARTRDRETRDSIIVNAGPLVERIARSFASAGQPHEDLVQEGLLGLIKAVDLFDPDRDVKFSTYASHLISGEIRHYLRDRCTLIREPAWLYELNQRINRAINEFSQRSGRLPSVPEIAKETNLREEAILEVLKTRNLFRVSSTDESVGEDAEEPIPVDRRKIRSLRHEDLRLPIEDRIRVADALAKLKPVQRKVVQMVYFAGLTQSETARKMGLSDNYIAYILRGALRRLHDLLAPEHAEATRRRVRRAASAPSPRTGEFDLHTGLHTQTAMSRRLAEEIARADRYGEHFAFAIVDIDRLTEFNRAHGLSVGDEAIAHIGAIIRNNLRRVDVAAKFEGGRYGLLMPHTADAAALVMQRICRSVAESEFAPSRRSPFAPGSLTVSVGLVLRAPGKAYDRQALNREAERALAEAKAQGGNTVACLSPPAVPKAAPTVS